jgi:hypothetical protein
VPAKASKVPAKIFQGIKKSAAFTNVVENFCRHFSKNAAKNIPGICKSASISITGI